MTVRKLLDMMFANFSSGFWYRGWVWIGREFCRRTEGGADWFERTLTKTFSWTDVDKNRTTGTSIWLTSFASFIRQMAKFILFANPPLCGILTGSRNSKINFFKFSSFPRLFNSGILMMDYTTSIRNSGIQFFSILAKRGQILSDSF